jgi:hypothetical protein
MEARLAVQVIANDIHATDCMRGAAEHREDDKRARQCRSQANAMQRQSHRALHKLEQLQHVRWTHRAAAALGSLHSPQAQGMPSPVAAAGAGPDAPGLPAVRAAPGVPPAIQPTAVQPTATQAAASQSSVAQQAATQPPASQPAAPQPATPQPAAPQPAASQPPASSLAAAPALALATAEAFAGRNRMLAMRIRHAGGLTRQSTAGFRPSALPSDPAVVAALVSGTSPILLALDGNGRDQRKAA